MLKLPVGVSLEKDREFCEVSLNDFVSGGGVISKLPEAKRKEEKKYIKQRKNGLAYALLK